MKLLLFVFFNTYCIRNIVTLLPTMDDAKYNEGKTQYELIVRKTDMPSYGKCWKNTLKTIETGCKSLTDIVQTKLALSYLNCFLQIQGRAVYECEETDSIQYCTRNMAEADRSSFATFFTHTQNICYFLEAQMWQEKTEETIDKLSDNSALVAEQLEESAHLQEVMILKQNSTLDNQERLMSQATDLNNIITSSSDNIHGMFDEFKKTTHEQRLLINDVFDRVTRLQTMVLGEISGFYSIVYYTLSIIICYLLTSTSRTSGARFWMFGIMTLNFICERVVVAWIPVEDILGPSGLDSEEEIYALQWICRKVALSIALTILVLCAYKYEDLNKMNNQLLLEIKKQNSDLKNFMLANVTLDSNNSITQKMIDNGSQSANNSVVQPPSVVACADTTGYESDSALSGYSSGSDTSSYVTEALDSTFTIDKHSEEQSETESLSTVTSYQSSSTKLSLLSELRALSENPTVEELQNRVSNWVGSGYYKHSTPVKDESPGCSSWLRRGRSSRHSTPTLEPDSSPASRYNLRPRKSFSPAKNPVTNMESPRSFSKTVKRLEKIAVKNSMLARFTVEKTSPY